MTGTLTETELKEIEARKPFQYGTMVSLTVAERDLLCRSLRYAWATIEALKSRSAYDWANIVETAQSENDSLRAQLAQAQERLAEEVATRINANAERMEVSQRVNASELENL